MTKDLQTLAWLTDLSIPAEIQDFWIKRYGSEKLERYNDNNPYNYVIYVLVRKSVNDGWYPQGMLARFSDGAGRLYVLSERLFTEPHMIKAIKLRAFL